MAANEDKGFYNEQKVWIPPASVLGAVEALIDAATERHYHSEAEETFLYCRMCDCWDSHEKGCPILMLQAWQDDV